MLNTKHFVDSLIERGVSDLCCVPCSFAKYLINEIINRNGDIRYVPCASEAVACSVAAGIKLSGGKPVVLVQSSGLTNMGSCITSLLRPYNILFPIIVSWRTYSEGDSEIQHKHLAKALPDLIHSYGYQYELLSQTDEATAVEQIAKANENATILVLLSKTFDAVELLSDYSLDLHAYPKRSEYLKALNTIASIADYQFIGTTGNTAREMHQHVPNRDVFFMAGNMGGALSLGYGAFLQGKHVIVCGGDAEFVMHMGGLTTAGRNTTQLSSEGSFCYILFDNFSNKSTGGQNTYQEHIDYINVVKAVGIYVHDETIHDVETFADVLKSCLQYQRSFLHVLCSYDDESPRPEATDIITSKQIFLEGVS